MRIIVTGDLHYRPSRRESYLAFAERVKALQPDCLILVGDTGHPLRLFRRALQLFGDLSCPRLVLAGNHDVYQGEFDSRTLWETALPQVAREEGFVWLEEELVKLPLAAHYQPADAVARPAGTQPAPAGADSALTSPKAAPMVGICGTMAWYDYSSHAPHLSYDDSEYRQLKHLVNHDADYINWPWSDVAMARYLSRRFAGRLLRLHADPAVQKIVVVTHMPIFAEAVPDYPQSEFWSLLRAYMGNLTLGELVRRMPKVTHVVSGHIHRPGQWQVQGDYRPIDVQLVGSQKGMPSVVVLNLEGEAVT